MEWKLVPFDDAIQKITYTNKIPRKDFLCEGAYPVISQESAFINGYWNNSSDVFKVDSPVIIFGDHTKVIKHIDFDFVLGADGVKIIKPISGLDSKFLAYFLESAPLANLGYARHFRILKELTVPFPPIPEQKRIVAILDQAFADIEQARAKTEQNLKNARELFESYLQQVFCQSGEGWIEAKLSDVCEGKITDGTHQTPKYFDEGYIFLSSRNVTSGEIDWNNIKYIDEAQHVAMQKRLSPRLNDILLAKNGTTGVAAIVDKDAVFDIYVSLALLRPSNKIVPRYLLHFVNSSVAKSQFNKRLKGAGVPNLHLEEIREVVISYPVSLKKQQQILKQIDLLLEQRNVLVGIYTRKLAAIDELKKSILQKAFTGQLTDKKGKGVTA
jgi:type I restriction enzyme, S subunit